MNKLSFLLQLTFFTCLALPLNAQVGCTIEITLSSQAEVDAFNGSTIIEGSLVIAPATSNGTTDITNLDALNFISQVTGTLLIERNPNLTDISGLSNLTTIGGGSCPFEELIIRENPQIASLSGLENVSGYVKRLSIQDAPLVADLNELSGITGTDFLWIGSMNAITNVDGLSNLTSLKGLFLTNNDNLLDIDGFANSTGPFNGGQDFISGNPSLLNLNGLAGITSSNILTVRNCDALTDLTGLGGLTLIGDQLSINNNPGLTSLNGLNDNLVIQNRLTIVSNGLLSDCAVASVCNHLQANGNNFITANPVGCSTRNDVLSNCISECGAEITETLTTQAEVDAFATTYGNCNNFLGEIIIEEPLSRSALTSITNVDALSSLRQVGVLRILNAPALSNLSGLALLDSINGDLDIRNTAIVNLSDLSNLKKIGGRLDIASNPVLESVTSFSNVNLIVNNAVIRFNPLLTDLSGFSNLLTVGDVLEIIGNSSLPDLTDFSSLRFTYDGLTINDNDMLTSLTGLETLENINAGLRILNNDLLADISTLSNIDQATIIATSNGAPGTAALVITDNPLLSTCAINTTCNLIAGSGTSIVISGNNTGCESQAIVQTACAILPITLTAFNARTLNKNIQLSWTTSLEENTRSFTLERSADNGRTFRPIGEMMARNSPNGATYDFLDETAASAGNNTLYYRLKAIDFDDSFEFYGPVRAQLRSVDKDVLTIFPNPASPAQSIRVQGIATESILELLSIDGRFIGKLLANEQGVYALPNVSAGVYLIRAIDDESRNIRMGRFVIQ